MALTEKQSKFVDEYCKHRNASKAAREAGYSVKACKEVASRLLTNANVSRAIQERLEDAKAAAFVDIVYVLTAKKEILERCLQRVPVMVFDPVNKEMVQDTDDDGNHIWKFDSIGANKAAELLGKHLGMYTQKIELDATIKMEWVEPDGS